MPVATPTSTTAPPTTTTSSTTTTRPCHGRKCRWSPRRTRAAGGHISLDPDVTLRDEANASEAWPGRPTPALVARGLSGRWIV